MAFQEEKKFLQQVTISDLSQKAHDNKQHRILQG